MNVENMGKTAIKILIGLLFLFCATITRAEVSPKIFFEKDIWAKGGYVLLESLRLKIDEDDMDDTINIYNIPDWNDPGDFHKLEIILTSGDSYLIYNSGDWVSMEPKQVEQYKSVNKLKTKHLLAVDMSDTRTALIIFGYGYVSDPGRLMIVEISQGNVRILYDGNFKMLSFADMDNDRTMEIVGVEYFTETCCIKDGVGYQPFHVLKMRTDALTADVDLSEEYNMENYIGFFGLEFDRDYRYQVIKSPESPGGLYFHFEKYRKYPQTSLKYLSEQDLEQYSKSELRLIRNEIFAFHGRKFESKDLQDYFSDQSWYKPTDKDINPRMNKYEKANIALIKRLENR